MYDIVIALVCGYILDLIIGDPHWLWHPVQGIGMVINLLENCLRKIFPKSKWGELIGGGCLVVLVLGITVIIPWILILLVFRWNIYAGIAIESIMCAQLLATKSLKDESMKVYNKLTKEDLAGARTAVSMIVGRDTKNLTAEGIMKATVETVAENTSDGSIAPMLYMAVGGPVFGFLYKAINTMDSMIGYKNENYIYFGRTAAKLDDAINFIPARLSAYLMIAAAAIKGYEPKNAIKIYIRDRYHHTSPNSAHTEAVTAGALGIQLAGDAYYFGVLYPKKTIGDPIRVIEAEDIKRANKLLYLTAFLGVVGFSIIRCLILYLLGYLY